jgi:hypothetical protein
MMPDQVSCSGRILESFLDYRLSTVGECHCREGSITGFLDVLLLSYQVPKHSGRHPRSIEEATVEQEISRKRYLVPSG